MTPAHGPRQLAQPSPEALPEHLAFGTIDRASVRTTAQTVMATYRDGRDICYEVAWAPGRCSLREYVAGSVIASSSGRDLEEAMVMSLWTVEDFSEHPRFVALAQRVLEAGTNTYFRYPRPGGDRVFYYPAGLLFDLRLPVTRENRAAWQAFRSWLDQDPALRSVVQRIRDGPGTILTLMASGEVRAEPVMIADLMAPLATLEAAVWVCAQSHVISPGLRYRLAVAEVSEAFPNHLTLYAGNQDAGEILFTVLPEELLGVPFPRRGAVAELMRTRGAEFRRSLARYPLPWPPAGVSWPSAVPGGEFPMPGRSPGPSRATGRRRGRGRGRGEVGPGEVRPPESRSDLSASPRRPAVWRRSIGPRPWPRPR
jgi:hypothetical protein